MPLKELSKEEQSQLFIQGRGPKTKAVQLTRKDLGSYIKGVPKKWSSSSAVAAGYWTIFFGTPCIYMVSQNKIGSRIFDNCKKHFMGQKRQCNGNHLLSDFN